MSYRTTEQADEDIVVYTDVSDEILMIRVLHGRQDWIARLSH